MAVAVPDLLDEDILLRQAETFDQKAERLRAQAREFAQQAIELRLAADRQRRAPVTITAQRAGVAPERDARLLAQIPVQLEQLGPCTSTVLAEHLNITQHRCLQALQTLERSKVVKRSGIRRGTIWGLAEDEDLSGHHPAASARTLVLDAGRKLDTFDLETLDAEIPMLSRSGISRALRELVEEGTFSEARDGRRKIYAYEKPTGPTLPRPKHEAPEAQIVELARRGGLTRRGGAIEGTGRRTRSGNPVVDELLRELNAFPIVEIVKRKHKYSFKVDGREVASCSTTPGASALAGTRRELNRAGIPV
jgi:hypothetical protein